MNFTTFKHILTGLLFLIILVFILNKPGVGNFELFNYNHTKIVARGSLFVLRDYPPLIYSLLSYLSKGLPVRPTSDEFYASRQFIVFKFLIFGAHLLSWLSI